MFKKALLLYSAGSFAALAQALLSFGLAELGWLALAHTTLTPGIGGATLYLKLVWGGLWSFFALFPGLSKMARWQQILLLSLVPSVAQLLYFMPQAGAGWFGLAHGWGTPLVVVGMNALWSGITLTVAQTK